MMIIAGQKGAMHVLRSEALSSRVLFRPSLLLNSAPRTVSSDSSEPRRVQAAPLRSDIIKTVIVAHAAVPKEEEDYKSIVGVRFSHPNNAWIATWFTEDGATKTYQKSVARHGFLEAKQMCEEARKTALAAGARQRKTGVPVQPAKHQSHVTGVIWHDLTKSWRATWIDVNGKAHQKAFRAPTHGMAAAMQMAIHARKGVEQSGDARLKKRAEFQSGTKGVIYCKGGPSWLAVWREDGQKTSRSFSVQMHTFEGAKKLAEAAMLAKK